MCVDNYNLEDEIKNPFLRRTSLYNSNKSAILEMTAFYESFFLNQIIKPIFFKDNSNSCDSLQKFITNRMTFMDRFKVVKDLAKKYNDIVSFKKFDEYINARNKYAHNIFQNKKFLNSTSTHEIIIGGIPTTWDDYLLEIKEWSVISEEMARFTLSLFAKLNEEYHLLNNPLLSLPFCKLNHGCLLTQELCIYPEPQEEYKSTVYGGGVNLYLIKLAVAEKKFNDTIKAKI
jgi:hypothetical protein